MKEREVISTLEENFWAWWEVYGRTGILRPTNYMKRWGRLRTLTHVWLKDGMAAADALATTPVKRLLRSPECAAAVAAWPWNARRRTFVTFHVAKHQNAAGTALIIRHRGDTYTLHNSYRGRGVTQAQGVTFFSWLPKKVEEPILPAATTPHGIVKLQMARKQLVTRANAAAPVASRS